MHRGIWALIQAQISQIDFDYAQYALVRLGEYHAWKGSEKTLREQRWAQE
jgi:ethanolamine kinase